MQNDQYEAVIGLEVHTQLLTQSKLFCADATTFGAAPNTQVSAISLAHPGTLPVMNEKVIELAVKLGLALHCDIVQQNYFARKNYFYPDLPKGYQVSQHTTPICKGGFVTIHTSTGEKNVVLNRIHMEEDAGKSIHDLHETFTAIDLNRAGTPLLEIVTEPCLHSSEEAYAYLTELRKLVRWLGVCNGNMEEGSMRCDANISIRPKGEKKLGTKVEVKNLNSIRNVRRAIDVELLRLVKKVEAGETIVQETRSFNADDNSTFSLRIKEDADDYRYFPEPDLPPFFISNEYITAIKSSMPELPGALQQKYMQQLELPAYDAAQITADVDEAAFFESIRKHSNHYKAIANWMMGPLKNYCNEHACSFADIPLAPTAIAGLIDFTESGKVNFNTAGTKILNGMLTQPGKTAEQVAAEMNLVQESDENAVATWVDETLAAMPEKVKEYQNGKKGLIGLFAGEVKKRSKGKADMQLVNKLLNEKLK